MPFDPTLPLDAVNVRADVLRGQFNGLKALIDAGAISGVVIDDVTTLPPGSPATASATMTGTVLHLSFALPAGNDGGPGEQGPAGNDGNPGEVTTAALNAAIAGTARNLVGVSTLDTPFADPDAESLRVAFNQLVNVAFRPPT